MRVLPGEGFSSVQNMSFLLMVCNSPFPLPHCSVKEKTIFLSDIYWLSNLPNSYCHERVHLEVWSSHSALEDFKMYTFMAI